MTRRLVVALIGVLVIIGARSAAAVEVERVVSPGGIEAWLVRDPTIPITSIEFSFRNAGAAADPADLPGLADMTSSLLDEGAGDLDSQAFQARLENNAIRLDFDAGQDTFRGSLKTLNRHRDEAAMLLNLALTKPRFDADAVERIRRQIIVDLRRKATDPHYRAGRIWRRLLYPGHPYGRPIGGTLASIEKIGADDMRHLVKTRFAKANLIVGAVGDIEPDDLGALLDRIFGDLPDKAAVPAIPNTIAAGAGQVVVAKMDIPQSVVLFGEAGVGRRDPDYYAAYVMNYVLGGGGFASRLYHEVREKRGLVYSVYSYLNPREHGPTIAGGLASRNAKVGEAIALVRTEWRRMRETAISADELANAKKFLNGAFPLRLSSTSQIARMLVGMQYYDLGIDYIERRKDYINKVQLADIRRVTKRLLHPDDLTVIVVGQPEGVTATTKTPDLGG